MLRAGLIGFPSTGKTTLFNLLARGAADRASGKLGRNEASIGSAEVPDGRLDRLTEIYNPKKRVPATVVFADVAGAASPRSLVDVGAYREADALLHVVRAFRADEVPHASGSIDPARDARAMEDELILADLAVAERRLERIERDMKKGIGKDLEKEFAVLTACRESLETGRACDAVRPRRREDAPRLSVLVGQTALARH